MTWWTKYEGAKFADLGRGPDVFDCWGLLRWIYQHDHPQKINLPSYIEVYDNTQNYEAMKKLASMELPARWREIKEPQEFDGILLRMEGRPVHVGVVTKKQHMIHCAQGINTCHVRYDSLAWRSKIIGFYRYDAGSG